MALTKIKKEGILAENIHKTIESTYLLKEKTAIVDRDATFQGFS